MRALLTMMVPIGLASFWPFRNNLAAHFAVTDLNAPRGRIVRVIQGDPRPGGWQTIVPEAADGVIDGATISGSRLLVRRFKDLGHQLSIYDLEGKKQSDVEIDGTVRINFERGDGEDNELFLDVDDRLRPARLERLDLLTGRARDRCRPPRPPTTSPTCSCGRCGPSPRTAPRSRSR